MATPLLWKANDFNRRVYKTLLYPYIGYTDIKNEKFIVERDQVKLVPFYLSFFSLTFTLSLCLYLILGIAFNHISLSMELFLLNLALSLYITLCTSLNAIIMVYLEELEITLRNLYSFEKSLCGFPELLQRQKDKRLGYFYLLNRELRKLVKGDKSADLMGLLMNGLVIGHVVTGILMAPIGIISGLDPGYHVFKNFCNSSPWLEMKTMFRFLLTQWCALEATRSDSLILVQAMAIFNIYIKCLQKMSKLRPGLETISLYKQLQCILQMGQQPVRYIAAVLMLLGFLHCVLGNIGIIVGVHIFSPQIYLLFIAITCIVYTVIYESVPRATQCHEFSKYMLEFIWGGLLRDKLYYRKSKSAVTSHVYKIWKKSLRAQKPITFCYGIAIFERTTKTNFYASIVLYSMDVLLLLQ